MAWEELKSSGITGNTPKNIMLGAGTIHRNFELKAIYTVLQGEPTDWATNYTAYFSKTGENYAALTGDAAPAFAADTYYSRTLKWNFDESLIGATSGGSKLSIVPEIIDIEVDGALVPVKGLRHKQGEKATIEVNFVEMTPELLKMCVVGDVNESKDYEGYSEITSRATIQESDYIENFAYVGRRTDGTPIIIIFEQCICTSGLEIEGKNKEAGVFAGTFECVADLTPEADTLPWRILYPTPAAA